MCSTISLVHSLQVKSAGNGHVLQDDRRNCRIIRRRVVSRAGSSLGSRLKARRLEAIFVRLERLEARS